jgi:hypothetical protein
MGSCYVAAQAGFNASAFQVLEVQTSTPTPSLHVFYQRFDKLTFHSLITPIILQILLNISLLPLVIVILLIKDIFIY